MSRHGSSRPLLALALCLLCCGCEDAGPRVYTAQLFRPDAGCLEAYAPVALVEAGDLGSGCDATCLVSGDDLYVSTVCAPYPRDFVVGDPAESPLCAQALASFLEDRSCE